MGARVLVAAWVGSTNLGDELVLSGLLRLLHARGAEVSVLSVDPAATTRVHGVRAVAAHDPAAVWRAVGDADGLVLGGGGLLQDETSPFNLPYHLSRVALARLRGVPVAGVGLGAGRLDTRLGRELVRRALSGAVAVSVRDADSARVLQDLGLRPPLLAADLAFAHPLAEVEAQVEGEGARAEGQGDRLVVCLRPWTGRRGRLPAGVRARRSEVASEAELAATAAALDAVAAGTGLRPHLVALQADRDGPLHAALADRMRAPVSVATPALADLVAEVGSGRVVVSMRYHGGVAAALARRPSVLIGYSPKVTSLAADLGAGAVALRWTPGAPAGLVEAVQSVLGAGPQVAAAVAALRERQRRNGDALEALLAALLAADRR